MSTFRILVVDGNRAATRQQQQVAGGTPTGEGYAQVLQSLHPGLECDIVRPADGPVLLPDDMSLESYAGVAVTGSALNIYDSGGHIERQVELARAVFAAGIPFFGSCWGLQVMMVALGGTVRLNPRGAEMGVARSILLTDAGRAHPMYAGKPAVFDALCVHQDEVDSLPDGAIRLAGNGVSDVQAVSLHEGDRSFWGVQYHPEYDLLQIAAMFKRSAKRLVDRGLMSDMPTAERFADELRALHDDPSRKDIAWRYGISADIIEPDRHRVEFANWLKTEVAPRMKAA